MDNWREFLRAVAPPVVKRLYRQMKSMTQATVHSLVFRVVTCRVRGVEVKIEISSPIERYRAESYSTKEPETLEWLERNLRPHDVFMDVGANIGLYSLFAAKLCSDCTVYAFEPESQNFGRLCRNLALNDAANVIPCNCALSNREVFDFFYVGELEAGAALHSFGRINDCRPPGHVPALKQGAVSVTFDSLVSRYGLPQPTLIKIDVDGTEEEILSGARKVLESRQLRSVLVELTTPKNEQGASPLSLAMERFGFCATSKGVVQEFNGLLSQNVIFER